MRHKIPGSRYIIGLLWLLAMTTPSWADAPKDDRAATRYPIVLVPGLFGYDRLLGFIDFWYDIPKALRRSGATVYVVNVSAANSSEVRGKQLLFQIDEIRRQTGADKVNLIGHSQGAPTIRYAAAQRPDLIASVTSVGGANQGSQLADRLIGLVGPDSLWTRLLGWGAGGIGVLIDLLAQGGLPQDGGAALAELTSSGAAEFNRRYPQAMPQGCGEGDPVVNGVRYYSWGGVGQLTTYIDPTDYLMWLGSLAFTEPNDGLVGHCSTHLGQVIRDDYPLNHVDQFNQVMGLTALGKVKLDELYLDHAARLKAAGL